MDLAPDLWPDLNQCRHTGKRQCRKQKYTKVEAQTVVNARMSARHNRPEHLRIYHCPLCNGWHVTHKENLND